MNQGGSRGSSRGNSREGCETPLLHNSTQDCTLTTTQYSKIPHNTTQYCIILNTIPQDRAPVPVHNTSQYFTILHTTQYYTKLHTSCQTTMNEMRCPKAQNRHPSHTFGVGWPRYLIKHEVWRHPQHSRRLFSHRIYFAKSIAQTLCASL